LFVVCAFLVLFFARGPAAGAGPPATGAKQTFITDK
jgi:hypothetical protein